VHIDFVFHRRNEISGVFHLYLFVSSPAQHFSQFRPVLLLNGNVKVLMRSALLTKEGIDAPASINPDPHAQILKVGIKINYALGIKVVPRSRQEITPRGCLRQRTSLPISGAPSRRFLYRRRHTLAEQFDSAFQTLTVLPKIGPEIAFFLQTSSDRFYIQGFRLEAGTKFSGQHRR
jgi:hypothetical protein